MKFLKRFLVSFFSPLASPNRTLYADALDVLYTAYRENLKNTRGHAVFYAPQQIGAAAGGCHI